MCIKIHRPVHTKRNQFHCMSTVKIKFKKGGKSYHMWCPKTQDNSTQGNINNLTPVNVKFLEEKDWPTLTPEMKTLTSPITSSVSIWVSLYNLFSILTFLLHSFILLKHLKSYKLLKCYANECWTYSRHPFFVPLHCPPILLARTPTHPSRMLNFTSTMKPFHTSPKRVKYFLCGAKALHILITLSRVFCLYPSLSRLWIQGPTWTLISPGIWPAFITAPSMVVHKCLKNLIPKQ